MFFELRGGLLLGFESDTNGCLASSGVAVRGGLLQVTVDEHHAGIHIGAAGAEVLELEPATGDPVLRLRAETEELLASWFDILSLAVLTTVGCVELWRARRVLHADLQKQQKGKQRRGEDN